MRLLGGIVAVVVVAGAVLGTGSVMWTSYDDDKAAMTTSGPYRADLESLQKHPLPAWFQDAKFGIMLDWGLYSVPGFASKSRTFAQMLTEDYDHAMTRGPYAEDYANQIKDPGSPAAASHRVHYRNGPYSDFRKQFDDGLTAWDPQAWAERFHTIGASYVVVTAKYADGYSMWPSAVRNPHAPDFHARRDLIGELAGAVRQRGMKFGVYYSGGVDWTFQPAVVQTLGDYSFLPYGEDYRAYAVAQVRELINRYRPDILWNDISWPTGQGRLNALLADYYNTVPDGVIDDRWSTSSFGKQVMGLGPLRWAFDQAMKPLLRLPGAGESVNTPGAGVPHSDFRTPEYAGFDTVQDRFWQEDRGIGGSFGYNRQETDADYTSVDTLLTTLSQAVANNGALLLNVGPTGGEGTIVREQATRLDGIGTWLAVNRDAVDGSRPGRRPSATTSDGTRVVFTRKGPDLYVIVLGKPTAPVVLKGVRLKGDAHLLGSPDSDLALATVQGDDTVLTARFTGGFAPAVRISGGAS